MKAFFFAVVAVAALAVPALAREPALGGNCPVCLVEMKKQVPGTEKLSVTFDRQVYYFPSAKEKEMFSVNPAKYVPALGGDCVYCRVTMGMRVPGKIEYAAIHDHRAYLFPSAKEREAFMADPQKYASADLGLAGYCSVCAVKAKSWVMGKPEIVSVYDGMRYQFPSQDEKKLFDADPAAYTPALEGDCVVCLKNAGKRIAGVPKFSALSNGRLYLFPDDAMRKMFLASPTTYANVDIAKSGNCVVCAKMMKKDVAGKPEFTSVYKGFRYQFPSAKERMVFDADPESFITKDTKVGANNTKNDNLVSVKGKTACAGCVYGVRPIGDSDSLGMAVVSGENVYIVEGGEKNYPELFKARFDSVTVELKGSIVKQQGKFTWIEPVTIDRSR